MLTKHLLGFSPLLAREAVYRTTEDTETLLEKADDALWEEAMLWKREGNEVVACERLARMSKDFPESRFAACVQRVCPNVPPPKNTTCHEYVVRDLGK